MVPNHQPVQDFPIQTTIYKGVSVVAGDDVSLVEHVVELAVVVCAEQHGVAPSHHSLEETHLAIHGEDWAGAGDVVRGGEPDFPGTQPDGEPGTDSQTKKCKCVDNAVGDDVGHERRQVVDGLGPQAAADVADEAADHALGGVERSVQLAMFPGSPNLRKVS